MVSTQTHDWEHVIEQLESQPNLLQDNWCLQPQAARLLSILALSIQAKSICEVGTSIGYSTVWLAKAALINNGQVHTIDCSPERQEQAKQWVFQAGLTQAVQFHQGQALAILSDWTAQTHSFDLVFIDAAKGEYKAYLEYLLPLLRSGGLFIADNTQSHRDAMGDFIERIYQEPSLLLCDLDACNGLIIARKA